MVVFTLTGGMSVGVNSRRVLYVQPNNKKGKFGKDECWIHMNDGTDLYVEESCTNVIKKVDKDRRKG